MIKKGDTVICVKKGPWTHYSQGLTFNHPIFGEKYIVQGVISGHFDSNNNTPYLILTGFNENTFLIDNFRKIKDYFADNILNNIKDQIIEEEFDKQLIEAGEYISKWKGN